MLQDDPCVTRLSMLGSIKDLVSLQSNWLLCFCNKQVTNTELHTDQVRKLNKAFSWRCRSCVSNLSSPLKDFLVPPPTTLHILYSALLNHSVTRHTWLQLLLPYIIFFHMFALKYLHEILHLDLTKTSSFRVELPWSNPRDYSYHNAVKISPLHTRRLI